MTGRDGFVKTAEWTSLTTLGLAGGLIAGLVVGMPLGKLLNAMIVTAAVTCLVGAVLGAFQAVGLRRLLRRPFWWILATIVGLGTGLAAAVVTVEQVGILVTGNRPHIAQLSTSMRALSFVAVGLVAGTLLGAAQALVIRWQMPQVRKLGARDRGGSWRGIFGKLPGSRSDRCPFRLRGRCDYIPAPVRRDVWGADQLALARAA